MKHKYGYTKDGKVFRHAFLHHEEIQIGIVKTTEEEAIQYFTKKYDVLSEKINIIEKKISEATNKGSYLLQLIHIKESIQKYKGLGDFIRVYEKIELLEKYLKEIISINKEKNKEAKEALIQELSTLIDHQNDIKHIQKNLKDIRERWIKKGDTFPYINAEYDRRFLSLLKAYYTQKKEYNATLSRTFYENKKKYKEIIEQIKHIQKKGKNKETIEQVKTFQRNWKTIGKVSIKDKQHLQKELQKVTDFFFIKDTQKQKNSTPNKTPSIHINKNIISNDLNRFDTKDNTDRIATKKTYFVNKKTISFPKIKEKLE
ncbi:MAG: DUF349 domain-containing protein [Chitinophagaceae bacterium]|nr:DUF349 domain-containing protein [Chitinophagaceae bacterium]